MLKGFPSIPQFYGFHCIMYVVFCIPVGYRNVRSSLLWIFNFFPVDCLDCVLIINIQLKLKKSLFTMYLVYIVLNVHLIYIYI